ncbi:serine/threonine-protein kinase [Leptolyngbya sp. PCC 6406]|uniref:serine/threonine-protein kinase n=1 Tax=Leptolyngbya sp. PCC 6406 TaxID=1173264 RepID=UPI0002ACE198|nr:serine/threonine-protein kinase [Leptolyngbya sp. PCC 6406]
MSYCINLDCPQPKNPPNVTHCQTCGASLHLRDRYRALRALGRGGFGATFLARDEALPGHPPCVIKQLRPSADAPHILEMARDLFQREAKILGKIGNHPQIPRLLDYFEINQEFFLVQEFINGNTLQQEVRRGGPFSEAGVKQFLSEALPLIQYVHNSGVIHRDLKPANLIRRDEDKKLVLIDFGAVKDKVSPVQPNSSEQTALTAYAIGTPGYAPPEQMAMRPVYASDLYAIGVTCIYLLTGKSPKELDYDPTTGEMLWREYVHISDHFAGVLQKMLEISVRHRYQSVESILRDLDLEPYMDSLAQNMAFPANPGRNNSPNSGPNSSDLRDMTSPSGGTSSPTSRMAAAIRARRERATRTGAAPPAARDRMMTNGPQTAGRSGKVSGGSGGSGGQRGKLTAEQIKTAYAKGQRDFSMQNLPGIDLQKVTLAGANFNQAQLPKGNFQGADLTGANFGRANLTEASFRSANLGRAYLTNTNLQGADLRGANLSYASLGQCNLRGANLCGADLTGARISLDQLALARTNWSTVYPNGKRGLMQ